MKRSLGRITKKSRLLGRNIRRRKVTIAEHVKSLALGSRVQIVPYAKYEDFPYPRYSGRVGSIVGKQGNAYIVEIKDGKVKKRIITSSVHLRKVG